MAQTYLKIQKQIQQLQRQAEVLRNSEVKGVVERIKTAIAHYELTAEQLGFGGSKAASAPKQIKAAKTAAAPSSKAKFSDENGNVWVGRGPRPYWLRDALAAGRSIDEFRVGKKSKAQPASGTPASSTDEATSFVAAPSAKTKAAKKSAPTKARYSDDAGHSWTGRGPKPGWLKAALDAGKTLEDFTS